MKGKKIKSTLLIAIFILSPIFAVMAMAALPEGFMLGSKGYGTAEWDSYTSKVGDYSVYLQAYWAPGEGDEARIVIPMPEGFTLGDLETISWWVLTGQGYPPHVDITLDVDGDGVVDPEDMLTAEMAVNRGMTVFDIETNLPADWVKTFELYAGDEYDAIDDTTIFWVTKMGAGNLDAPSSTLANWKLGVVDANPGADPDLTGVITASTPVLKLEIEVDNWVADTVAFIDDVEINGVVYGLEFVAGDPVETVVSGDGDIYSEDADTEVTYTGAVDDTILIQDIEEDEIAEATFGAVGEYVDVKLAEDTNIDELWITVYYTDDDIVGLDESQLIMYWYDGTNWVACSDYSVDEVANSLTAYVNDVDTSPLISQMIGTPFGPGGGLALDAEYYNSYDIVSVMLGDTDQNTDPEVAEVASVNVWSDTDPVIGSTIALMETGVDTGVFAGTFNLVGVSPGAGELLVSTGDFIYVEYFGCMPSMKQFSEFAIVDDWVPVVEIIAIDGVLVTDVAFSDFVTGVFDITVDIDDEYPFDILCTGDTSLIAKLADQTSDTFDIEWDTEAELLTVPLWPDDTYTVTVTATDGAGNTGADSIILTVDNTGPTVTDATASPSLIGLDVPTDMVLKATVVDAGIGVDTVTVDCSSIDKGTVDLVQVGTTDVYKATVTDVDVDTEDTYELTITAIDELGNENSLVFITLEVIDDTDGPTGLTFTDADPICGGLIIKGLDADDPLTGVAHYKILMNKTTTWLQVLESDLTATTWTSGTTPVAFNNMVVLAGYAGKYVNVTVIAYDQATNPSKEIILYEGMIPEGEWSPVRLYTGWNLVSLPLIPDSSDIEDVLSLILDQGANGVIFSYSYNQYTDTWTTNPAEMPDGSGYWLYMLDDDVMIVEGKKTLLGPTVPVTYEFTKGWVLAGYKQIAAHDVEDYLISLPGSSYFGEIYIYRANTGVWDTVSGTEDLHPGMGFWIFMHSDQSLITPLE